MAVIIFATLHIIYQKEVEKMIEGIIMLGAKQTFFAVLHYLFADLNFSF